MKSHNTPLRLWLQLSLLLVMTASFALAQQGTLVRRTLRSAALEHTLTGESPKRAVSVYLPPSYDSAPAKHYPVVYLLHGVGDTDETWTSGSATFGNVQSVMDRGIAEGKFGEMIVVMPNEQRTIGGGSYYLDSAVTGKWEVFTTEELVDFIDTRYRTLPRAESRALAGHSMGGYGALVLGMKHPERYRVVYGMNPSLIGWQWGGDLTIASPAYKAVLQAKSFEELLTLDDNFYAAGIVVVAQAFSPNPDKPPFFADFPFALVRGTMQPAEPAFSKWQALNPVNMVSRYRENLRQLRGLRFDSGYDDPFAYIPVNSRALSLALSNNGIAHTFEEYNGDHSNRMWGAEGRLYNEVLPYLWARLAK